VEKLVKNGRGFGLESLQNIDKQTIVIFGNKLCDLPVRKVGKEILLGQHWVSKKVSDLAIYLSPNLFTPSTTKILL